MLIKQEFGKGSCSREGKRDDEERGDEREEAGEKKASKSLPQDQIGWPEFTYEEKRAPLYPSPEKPTLHSYHGIWLDS